MDNSPEIKDIELEITPDERVMVEVLRSFTTMQEIEALEAEVLQLGANKVPVIHGFCKGIYTRQIDMPAGHFAIGDNHTEECLNIVTKGSMSVMIDGYIFVVKAPCQFVSPPFTRKIGFVHSDITWITVHPTDLTDIQELEKSLIIKSGSYKRYAEKMGEKSTEIANCPVDDFWLDRVDYFNAVKDLGMEHEDFKIESHVPFPLETGDLVSVRTSPIHGNGIFCNYNVDLGTTLCPIYLCGKITIGGKYVNHSRYPNCALVATKIGDINLVAAQGINIGHEITVDYRQAQSVARQAQNIRDSIK